MRPFGWLPRVLCWLGWHNWRKALSGRLVCSDCGELRK